MSQLEQRLARDLDDIRSSIHRLGIAVHEGLSKAVEALVTGDSRLSYQVILGDHPVNREVDALNLKCHRFIAKHLPSAGHLRFISSSLRIIILIERLGDYAVTISRESVQMKSTPSGDFKNDLEKMAGDALTMLHRSLTAYSSQDPELATSTSKLASSVDRDFLVTLSDLLGQDMDLLTRSEQFARLVIVRQIERVADQAKNLCEEVVFSSTGKTKQRRRYRLLFLDAEDNAATQIAVALCRKLHADRISSSSLGKTPAEAISRDIQNLCEERGLELSGQDPSGIYSDSEHWRDHDVLITLNSDIADYCSELPYGVVPIRWDLPLDAGAEQVFHFISDKVDDLVHLVRGPSVD